MDAPPPDRSGESRLVRASRAKRRKRKAAEGEQPLAGLARFRKRKAAQEEQPPLVAQSTSKDPHQRPASEAQVRDVRTLFMLISPIALAALLLALFLLFLRQDEKEDVVTTDPQAASLKRLEQAESRLEGRIGAVDRRLGRAVTKDEAVTVDELDLLNRRIDQIDGDIERTGRSASRRRPRPGRAPPAQPARPVDRGVDGAVPAATRAELDELSRRMDQVSSEVDEAVQRTESLARLESEVEALEQLRSRIDSLEQLQDRLQSLEQRLENITPGL